MNIKYINFTFLIPKTREIQFMIIFIQGGFDNIHLIKSIQNFILKIKILDHT